MLNYLKINHILLYYEMNCQNEEVINKILIFYKYIILLFVEVFWRRFPPNFILFYILLNSLVFFTKSSFAFNKRKWKNFLGEDCNFAHLKKTCLVCWWNKIYMWVYKYKTNYKFVRNKFKKIPLFLMFAQCSWHFPEICFSLKCWKSCITTSIYKIQCITREQTIVVIFSTI